MIAVDSGATLEVLPADAASAWGLRPWLMIVDEHAAWPGTPKHRRLWEAIVSAMPKVPGARLVVLTSAGSPGSWPHQVMEAAKGSKRWCVHEVGGPLPWADPVALEEQRRLLTPSQYARLHLNRWTAAEDRSTTLDAVRACVSHEGPLAPVAGRRYVVGVDLGVKNDRSVVVVAHSEQIDGDEAGALRVVVDRLEKWSPRPDTQVDLSIVEAAIEHASSSYNGAAVVMDPWQGLGIAQRLRRRGVRVTEFTFSSTSVGRLGLTLLRLLQATRIGLPDDAELIDELISIEIREPNPGVYRMDHEAGRHDDQAVAIGLAAQHLVERSNRRDPGSGAFVDVSVFTAAGWIPPADLVDSWGAW